MRAREGGQLWITPAGRLRGAFMIVVVIVTAVSGGLQLALLVGLFGTIAGVALNDAGRLRTEVEAMAPGVRTATAGRRRLRPATLALHSRA